jgi:hypothetical protein
MICSSCKTLYPALEHVRIVPLPNAVAMFRSPQRGNQQRFIKICPHADSKLEKMTSVREAVRAGVRSVSSCEALL